MYIAIFDARKIYKKILPIIDTNSEPIICETEEKILEKLKESIFYGKIPYCILNLNKLKWKM